MANVRIETESFVLTGALKVRKLVDLDSRYLKRSRGVAVGAVGAAFGSSGAHYWPPKQST